MKENEFPLLRVTNIEWDKDHEELDKLPKNLELKWDSKKWNVEQVSNWLSKEWVKTVEFQKESWAQAKEQNQKNKLYIQDLFNKVKNNVSQD